VLACLSDSISDTDVGQSNFAAAPPLRFAFLNTPVASEDVVGLRQLVSPDRIRVFEPYEGREISFDAIPLAAVLDAIYSETWRTQQELLFTCSDGYQPTVPIQRVLEHKAWLAFDRADEEGFSITKLESGRRRRIDLAPFYLIWENLDDAQVRLEGDYGWPYQLVGIDVIRTRDRFPDTAPSEGAPNRVLAGYASFRVHCSRCHAINGEGGSIGPDLNVPVNPVDYRERAWLRRWIDDPAAIRPESRMPRMNPALLDRAETIENIIAYLEAMSERKRPLRAETVDGS
jgi:mono/diheme cytochrome c family protein